MGLDMYLYKRRRGSEEDPELVAYWRKANQIHGWFERNAHDGFIENCEYYPLCKDDLRCLVADCRLVLDKPELADSVLPATEGFFFGSTLYDDYYFESLSLTVEQVERVLAEAGIDDRIYYRAWW